jgi:fucose permease
MSLTIPGGVIYPIMIRRLLVSVGFPWTTRILGFLNLFLTIVALVIFFWISPKTSKSSGCFGLRDAPKSRRALFQLKAFIEPTFALYALAGLLQFLAFYVPVFFLPTYGSRHLGLSPDLAYYMLAVLNGSSAFGRTLPSLIADKIGPFPVLVASTFASSAVLFGWIGVHNLGGFIAFTVLYGFTSGVFITCSPVCVTLKPISPDLSVFGTRLGMILVWVGAGVLIGSPCAGALVKGDDFVKMQVFSAVIMAAAGIALLYPWMVTERVKKMEKQRQQELEAAREITLEKVL